MLRRVKRNQVRMIHDRGYVIPEDEQIYLEESNAPSSEPADRNDYSRIYINPEGRLIYVVYLSTPKSEAIGIDPVRKLFDQIDELGQPLQELVLITNQTLGATAIDFLNGIQRTRDGGTVTFSLSIPPDQIQHFFDADLAYNPTQHYLVPKHEALTPEEQQQLLQNNKIDLKSLPILIYSDITTLRRSRQRGDPIVKYYRFRPNQIIRITRRNFLTETLIDSFVTYRRVWY